LTISVPEAGEQYYGLSRKGSYDAAKRGEIPTIRVGKLERLLGTELTECLDEPPDLSEASKFDLALNLALGKRWVAA
jgi:hypothetical protein